MGTLRVLPTRPRFSSPHLTHSSAFLLSNEKWRQPLNLASWRDYF